MLKTKEFSVVMQTRCERVVSDQLQGSSCECEYISLGGDRVHSLWVVRVKPCIYDENIKNLVSVYRPQDESGF